MSVTTIIDSVRDVLVAAEKIAEVDAGGVRVPIVNRLQFYWLVISVMRRSFRQINHQGLSA